MVKVLKKVNKLGASYPLLQRVARARKMVKSQSKATTEHKVLKEVNNLGASYQLLQRVARARKKVKSQIKAATEHVSGVSKSVEENIGYWRPGEPQQTRARGTLLCRGCGQSLLSRARSKLQAKKEEEKIGYWLPQQPRQISNWGEEKIGYWLPQEPKQISSSRGRSSSRSQSLLSRARSKSQARSKSRQLRSAHSNSTRSKGSRKHDCRDETSIADWICIDTVCGYS